MSEATAPAAAPSTTTGAPATAPTAPASETAKDNAAGSAEKPASERKDGLPESRSRPEQKKAAAAALRDMLTERRRAESSDDDGGDAAEAKPKSETREKTEAKDKPEGARERSTDGKFAAKEGAQQTREEPKQQPAQDRGENDQKLSRAIRELNHATSEREGLKRENALLKRESEQRKAREESWKRNPLDALQDIGWDLDRVAREVVEKGLRPSQRAQLPEEVQREIDANRQFRERYESQERQREQQRQRGEDVKAVGGYVQANADKYPFTAALEWATGVIVDNTRANKQADATANLVAFEKSMAETTLGLLGNERVLDHVLASKPELAKALVAKLRKLGHVGAGNEATPPASKGGGDDESTDGPSSVSSVPSSRSAAPKTRGEQKRAAVADFKNWARRRSEADDE